MADSKKGKRIPKTLKPIRSSRAIEKDSEKALKGFTREMLKSMQYWTRAQFNKKERGDIENLTFYLRKEFNALRKQWQANASDFAKRQALKQQKEIIKYVNANYASQGINAIGANEAVKQGLRAHYLENLELIKSIPNEIIKRYESALYNSVNNFDTAQISKQLSTIGGISLRRAETIARDQVSKAIESYASTQAQSFGFEYYVWETAQDERVSSGKGGHNKLQGRIYRYDTPTAIIDSYGNKGHCGQRVNCRCVTRALMLEPNQKLKLVKDSNAGDYYELI